jgi:hypothetical protein
MGACESSPRRRPGLLVHDPVPVLAGVKVLPPPGRSTLTPAAAGGPSRYGKPAKPRLRAGRALLRLLTEPDPMGARRTPASTRWTVGGCLVNSDNPEPLPRRERRRPPPPDPSTGSGTGRLSMACQKFARNRPMHSLAPPHEASHDSASHLRGHVGTSSSARRCEPPAHRWHARGQGFKSPQLHHHNTAGQRLALPSASLLAAA